MTALLPSDLPICQAPLAGGPSTPELTAAVSAAGGYGFLAAGYLSADALDDLIARARELTPAAFGVNVFVPARPGPAEAVATYAQTLAPEAERLGSPLGQPRWDDDEYGEKLLLLLERRVDAVSFTFGCPSAPIVERLHGVGTRTFVTVTSRAEAEQAAQAGADAVVVQGTEAGGHQAGFLSDEPNTMALLDALAEIAPVGLPMIAAGGVMTGEDVAAVLGAGAAAAALGTALLCTPEAATSEVHRRALLERRYDETVITRAFSGRYARGLANRFAVEHPDAPAAYPEIHHLTKPLRAAAAAAGNSDVPNLWAGTGWAAITDDPAGDVVRRVAEQYQAISKKAGSDRPGSPKR